LSVLLLLTIELSVLLLTIELSILLLWTIELSILLRLTDSDYLFDIFKLFMLRSIIMKEIYCNNVLIYHLNNLNNLQ
jgi:hypothetical protein